MKNVLVCGSILIFMIFKFRESGKNSKYSKYGALLVDGVPKRENGHNVIECYMSFRDVSSYTTCGTAVIVIVTCLKQHVSENLYGCWK